MSTRFRVLPFRFPKGNRFRFKLSGKRHTALKLYDACHNCVIEEPSLWTKLSPDHRALVQEQAYIANRLGGYKGKFCRVTQHSFGSAPVKKVNCQWQFKVLRSVHKRADRAASRESSTLNCTGCTMIHYFIHDIVVGRLNLGNVFCNCLEHSSNGLSMRVIAFLDDSILLVGRFSKIAM